MFDDFSLQTWNRLIQEFATNHTKFSASDRAQIIDDAFALSKAGKPYTSLYLSILQGKKAAGPMKIPKT